VVHRHLQLRVRLPLMRWRHRCTCRRGHDKRRGREKGIRAEL
jgi:hypothetical protein